MSNWEWLYRQNAKRRRLSDMQLRMQMEQQNIQNFLLLNTDTMSYMPGGDTSGSYQFDIANGIVKANQDESFPETGFTFSSSDDFCVEWFQYHFDTTHTPRSTIFSINELTSFGVSFEYNLLTLWISDGTTPILQADFEQEEYTEKWIHIAIVRKSGVIHVYKNGFRVFSVNNSTAQTEDFFPLTIGSSEFDRPNTLFQGRISNFRFVIGNSVYDGSSSIQCPSSPVQDILGARLILNALFSNPYKDLSSYDRKVVGSAIRSIESPFPFNPEIFLPIHHIVEYDFSNLDSYPGTGATVYDLKDGINAQLFNSPTYVGSGPKYISFNGSNQYLVTTTDLSPYFFEYPNKITLSIWVYPSDNGVIISERGQTALAAGWHTSQIEMVGSTAEFGMWSSTGLQSIASSIPTPLSNWYYLTLKYDGFDMTAYVNGATAGSLTFDIEPPYENPLYGLYYTIAAGDGTNMGDGSYSNMRLGSFDVHSIDLTYEEILSDFESSRSRFGI